MSIKTITADRLRSLKNSEGLILQGCGGNLDEWVDGINDMLTQNEILLDGTGFKNCLAFEHDGLTCLLFPFDNQVKLNVGKLAVWRLQTHEAFGGTWLSDYVPNRLDGFLYGQDEDINDLFGEPDEDTEQQEKGQVMQI